MLPVLPAMNDPRLFEKPSIEETYPGDAETPVTFQGALRVVSEEREPADDSDDLPY